MRAHWRCASVALLGVDQRRQLGVAASILKPKDASSEERCDDASRRGRCVRRASRNDEQAQGPHALSVRVRAVRQGPAARTGAPLLPLFSGAHTPCRPKRGAASACPGSSQALPQQGRGRRDHVWRCGEACVPSGTARNSCMPSTAFRKAPCGMGVRGRYTTVQLHGAPHLPPQRSRGAKPAAQRLSLQVSQSACDATCGEMLLATTHKSLCTCRTCS